ncbi:MAG: cell division FtsK/SpoIIIE [Candidatus Woesebacteria bacterium GW2011_GWA1_39_21]|uniref:Cell division FtsK/SpoIIIE n=1 Tax=Candidatus Woesebacteria bacterium GW2011_GWA1_39_21 TaxID=1618550 RepID=A0A0G0RDE0_9BACT|nr:MAG: cell division FtsK/SpoIIIE [Candidatus Woesebacteria bacterium GW2011_GWA1_39_21]
MSKRRHHKTKSKKAFKLKLKPATLYSIAQITFYVLAGLILVSFTRNGVILYKINELLTGLFSWGAIFLPFLLISFGLLVSRLRIPLSQPNVVVGFLLFFISVVFLTKAGKVGMNGWRGISSLITDAGAFIVLFGTSFVGLVILFNTSIDQVYMFLREAFRKYGVRGKMSGKKPLLGGVFKGGQKLDLKVSGDKPAFGSDVDLSINQPKNVSGKTDIFDPQPAMQKTITNSPGEERVWRYPPVSVFTDGGGGKANRGDIKNNAATIEQTLESFGIAARVVEVNLGPAVTQYALEVALGTKLSKITALERDLALALAAPTGTIRIEAPIPGRSLVGIELPNITPEFVPLRKMLESDVMKSHKSKLAVSLGLDVSGKPIVADLSRMPHVLIAGQTGSGKSICINAFLSTLLFRASPSELKLILVDPKRVEMTNYNDIPHLLSPVIIEPNKVVAALKWLMNEMDRRYKLFAEAGARNIDAYNEMSGFQAMPYIVLLIDELADIMLLSPVEVEDTITRIAQMSRATGIHMVLATQRPSVNIITGLIKANIPCRISFAVSSQVDSRVILDTQGAEKLLGRGDMLYLPPEQAKPMRIQGAFVSDRDINSLVSFVKNQGVVPQYTEEVTSTAKDNVMAIAGLEGDVDEHFEKAVELVCQFDKASASMLQRRLSVGYARAARIMDQLESAGVIAPATDNTSKGREVLIRSPEEIFTKKEEGSPV